MNSSFKQLIDNIASPKAPGPPTAFTAAHIFFALEQMAEKPTGRNRLAKKLEVGEGTIRTIISRLKVCGLIETSRRGCSLTSRGYSVWKEFEKLFPKRVDFGKTELTNAEYNYAFMVKNSGARVKSGIEQRDAAIVAGATGAVIIVSKRGHLTIESVSNSLERQFPAAANRILKTIQPEENDVVIMAGAAVPRKARYGAFAASWTLVAGNEHA